MLKVKIFSIVMHGSFWLNGAFLIASGVLYGYIWIKGKIKQTRERRK